MTSTDLFWAVPALLTLAAGWFACDWTRKRKFKALQDQIKAVRQTAQEHASQARQQIGQLQAELAARPPMIAALREQRAQAAAAAAAASAAAAAAAEKQARRDNLEKVLDGDGFATTDVSRHGFAITEVMT